MNSRSEQLFARAQIVIPGGVNSPVRAFRAVGGTPLFFVRGAGAYLWDADGKRYIDYVGSWGPAILGHAHPETVRAVQETAKNGLSFGAPTELEIEMAETLCCLLPSLEMVRLVSSGTEATMTALRLARGYTGRPKIIKFEGCYHGHGVVAAFEAHPGEIAGIIVEPVAGNMNLILPRPGFLQGLRDVCDRNGAVLIFDEVMTGFRLNLQGAQGLYGIAPDLTTLGKVIGGGMPVGAFGGRRAIMEKIAPLGPVYQAGTLSGNPVAVAAGLATLRAIQAPGFYARLAERTLALATGLVGAARRAGVEFSAQAIGGMFGIYFARTVPDSFAAVVACDKDRFKLFFHRMLEAGIYLAPSAFEAGFVSAKHNTADIDETVRLAEESMRAVG